MKSWPDFWLGVAAPVALVAAGCLAVWAFDFVDAHLIRRRTHYLDEARDQPWFQNAGVRDCYHSFAWAVSYTRKRPRKVVVIGWKWRRRARQTAPDDRP